MKFFNDIRAFFFGMDSILKISILAILVVCISLMLMNLIKAHTKDKFKVKIIPIIWFIILILLTAYIAYCMF